MKKVLFITYYWHPSGKASFYWPLKIIKHLPTFGWQPVVLTVKQDTFSQPDTSFEKDISPDLKVIRTKSFDPFNIYKKLTGKKSDEQLVASETISKTNKSLIHRISIWLRMNLFIPDARVGWYFPAVRTAGKALKNENIAAIVSVGPPHTTHLIGKKLSKKLDVPHVPVFIDPWVDIAYYQGFKRSALTLAIDNRLEKTVMKNAQAVVFVTQTLKVDYEKKYLFLKDKSHVLYWGYSEEDFDGVNISSRKSEEKVIVHAGNIFSYQNPVKLWEYLKQEIDQGEKVILKFIGTVDPAIKKSIEQIGLSNRTEYLGFLPYKKMLEEITNADYLLVCATEPRHLPGKLFEYLRTGNYIIAFGNNNEEVKEILTNANAGRMFGYYEDPNDLFNGYNLFSTNKVYVKSFERKIITESLSNILLRLKNT